METITFDTVDNNITLTVKAEFASLVPDYKTTPVRDLVEKHQIFKFFHNPNGVATIDRKINVQQYFINGQLAEGEELEKIKHREQFNGKMDEVLHGS